MAFLKDSEVRVVDPTTGGEKGVKVDRYDLIPHEFEEALAIHYGMGAKKYADRNWERGYKWGYSWRAARGHMTQWANGERFDAETGSHHLISAIWHLIALYIFDLRHLGTDDLTRLKETDIAYTNQVLKDTFVEGIAAGLNEGTPGGLSQILTKSGG